MTIFVDKNHPDNSNGYMTNNGFLCVGYILPTDKNIIFLVWTLSKDGILKEIQNYVFSLKPAYFLWLSQL